MQKQNIETNTLLNVRESEKGREYQLPSGVWVPSITSVLGYFKAQSLKGWCNRVGEEKANFIMKTAAETGTRLHLLCEKHLNGEKINLWSLYPDDKQLYLKMRPYLNRITNIRFQEVQLFSENMKIAGRTDVIGEFDGILSIIDFKNTTKEKTEEQLLSYYEQETGYSLMYEEMTGVCINNIVTLMVGPMVSEAYIRNRNNYKESFLKKVKEYHEIHPISGGVSTSV